MCDSTHCSANDRVGTVRSACPRGARSASVHGFGGPRPDGGPESRSSQPRRTAEANSCTPAVLEPKRGEIACGRRRAGMASLAKWAADEHADIKLSTSSSCISVTAVEPCRSSSATVPGTADSEPAGTEIITALAIDARGQPTNGYREAPAGSISELAGWICSERRENLLIVHAGLRHESEFHRRVVVIGVPDIRSKQNIATGL